ncbi:hypothetical protein GCM10023185_08090 [Hymenobacter saemangeumensis]|uniref:HTH cro/C1-type domain-containing protein n=1 Tax=Hymenobacter saemangeumensis TaxID=1084522 RepID=A0ABP8I344_9BACT
MGRPCYPSPTLAAAVRAHFGLNQDELARFVGVSRAQLANVEAGRRELAEAPRYRLWVLARQLPPPDGLGPAAPDFAARHDSPLLSAADTQLLQKRLDHCRYLLTKARYELGQEDDPARHAARRRWAVAVLRPALAALPDAASAARWPGATPNPPADLHWLAGLETHTQAAPPPLSPGQHVLAQARLHALEAEAAALQAALLPVPRTPGARTD